MTIHDEPLLIFDGACGTAIQEMNLPPASFGGERYLGYNEYLNLSAKDAIVELHASFIEAGANVIETNTFGANPIVAREYGLENRELKELLNFKDTTNYELVPGKIISKLVSKTHGNFIVNIGISDSVKAGMPIVNSDGLVGIITDVSEDFSVVRTLGNSELNLAVTNQRSNVNGILSWNGSQLVIKNIPTNFDNETGFRIIKFDGDDKKL